MQPAALRLLRRLQRSLEALYRLEPAPAVTEFLLPWTSQGAADRRAEELLVAEDEDLHVGLRIDPAAVRRLVRARQLEDANLGAFCLAVEGVSHFLLLVHRCHQRQSTTVLELELQAEVDKYVASMVLARRRELRSSRVRQRLYQRYRLVDGLSAVERQRYERANHLARRYTGRLEQRFIRRRRVPAMLGELRRFYRMPYAAKQALIDASR